VVIIALTGFTLSSCKKNITDPPPMGAPDIVANISIHDIKTRYSSGTPVEITDDAVIEGVVSCDDKSGNYYQQIAIQDATGGVLLRIAGNNHYLDYPVGRKIYVKLKGLYLGQYNGTLQFGGGIDQAYASAGGVTLLAANLQDQHIVKGPLNQPLVPQVVNVSQLTTDIQDKYVSTLIKLVGYEFDGSDLGKNYADDGFSGNRTISSCSNPATNHITLRTSNYCNFATIGLPQGNGDIIGIYSFFGSTKQLTIRDTSDVQFYGPRCPSPSGGGMLSLTSSPLTLNFDALSSSGLPAGVYVKHNATSSALGIEGSIYNGDFNTGTAWNQFSAGFKNYASATGLPSTASSGTQNASTNRALGVRQTSSTGDPGSAFAFLMPNTTGKTNLKLEFKLQSLDASPGSGRTTVWKVDYGFGNNPSSFTTVTTSPASLSTVFGSFSNTTVNVDFGSALNNISQPVWVRIVTLDNTTGGGNRPSTAVDDVKFSWN
ncbi:MAG TPA: DUF5689 domain-containing protein, partial [Chitinophagaceae bacterium]|nr:DUF5689 domain-containing protein [Chitinophagaceae bacterium]